MVATQDYTWEQGEDLLIEIIYQVNGSPVDMSNSTHAVRMDIAPSVSGAPQAPIFSFNSMDFDDPNLDEEGDHDNEVTFGGGDGKIVILVPRSLTLTGGAVATALSTTKEFMYDLFLRDITQDTQKKLLTGKITVKGSVTKWL